jgi:hypothetical protein
VIASKFVKWSDKCSTSRAGPNEEPPHRPHRVQRALADFAGLVHDCGRADDASSFDAARVSVHQCLRVGQKKMLKCLVPYSPRKKILTQDQNHRFRLSQYRHLSGVSIRVGINRGNMIFIAAPANAAM